MEVVVQLLSIFASLVLLSLLVTVHELGHYGAGRLLDFKIDEFAIGLGPKIFGREKNGIIYSIRALPIGGMCRFHDEDEAVTSGHSFNAQKPWKRFLVILAGPLMNILFTFILAAVLLMTYGGLEYQPTVRSLAAEGSKAAEAGMLPGDILYAVDGVEISDYSKTIDMIRGAGNDATITVLRGQEKLDFQLHDIYNQEAGHNVIGVNIEFTRKPYGFFESIGKAFPFVFSIIRETFQAFGDMFKNGVKQGDIVGVVGAVATISYAVRTGFEMVLYIAVLISISLAIFNLLPIPALDGGRMFFILLEAVRGKPIPPEKEGMVHLVGFVILMGFALLITFSDVKMLLGW